MCKFSGDKHAIAMKVNAWICAPATDRDLESGLSKSASVRTRKMVNYAREGAKSEETLWRLVAILTCKSFVILGCRGERLIEPSSCWFTPGVSFRIAGVEQLYQVKRMIRGIGNVLFLTYSQNLNR